MNIKKLQRVYKRFFYCKDSPVYSEFLEYVNSFKDVWKASQLEVASWWERRQRAEIDLEIVKSGILKVTCSLRDCVIEVNSKDLIPPPLEISVSSELAIGKVNISCYLKQNLREFFNEILAHFGYRHIKIIESNVQADIKMEELKPVVLRLFDSAKKHWRFNADDIENFRSIIKKAHNRKGLPEIRLWSLPKRDNTIFKVCISPRFDVDKAIINLHKIHLIEEKYGVKSTVYLRPLGYFYSQKEIKDYSKLSYGTSEIALHGEFVNTAERFFGDEFNAAKEEKRILEDIIENKVEGVCMHGGELRSNVTQNTWKAVEQAEFKYETMYRNKYYLPIHLPDNGGVRRTLSIGQHFADVSVEPNRNFIKNLSENFIRHFNEAKKVGGIFVLVMHPIYFSLSNYLLHSENIIRLSKFFPIFLKRVIRMRKDQEYSNVS